MVWAESVITSIILATTSKKEGKKAVEPNGAAMLKGPRKNTATWQ